MNLDNLPKIVNTLVIARCGRKIVGKRKTTVAYISSVLSEKFNIKDAEEKLLKGETVKTKGNGFSYTIKPLSPTVKI